MTEYNTRIIEGQCDYENQLLNSYGTMFLYTALKNSHSTYYFRNITWKRETLE